MVPTASWTWASQPPSNSPGASHHAPQLAEPTGRPWEPRLLLVADARARASVIRDLAAEILFDGQACDRVVPASADIGGGGSGRAACGSGSEWLRLRDPQRADEQS